MAIYTVNTRADVTDAGDGLLSFREAVALARANPGRDEIRFAPELKPEQGQGTGGQARVRLTQGEVEIDDPDGLVIDGDVDGDGVADAVLLGSGNATPNQRVLVVTGGALDMRHLVLSGGVAQYGAGLATYGGNLAIYEAATVTMQDGRVERGFATFGGGVENRGGLTLVNVSITDNTALGGGGGGGLSNFGAATLINVTVTGNDAGGEGGGILTGNYEGNRLILRQSTVTGNTAGVLGGGIRSGAGEETLIVDSIILGNSGGAGDLSDGGGQRLQGTVLADGTIFRNGVAGASASAAEVFASLDGTGGGVALLQGGSARTVALRAGSPATFAVAPQDVAPDVLDLDGDGDTAEAVPFDANGAPRTLGGYADLGAVQGGRLVVTTLDDEGFEGGDLAAEALDGTGLSLREALALAQSGDTVAFAPDDALAGTRNNAFGDAEIELTRGQLVIDRFVRLDGAIEGGGDVLIDGGGATRVFDVRSGAVLSNLVLTGGFADEGGAVRTGAGTVTLSDVLISSSEATLAGGAIHASGRLFLSNALIVQNAAGATGGGVHVAPTGDVRAHNVTLYGNVAPAGGAIYMAGDFGASGGTSALSLSSTTITGNVTSGGGGAVERDVNAGAGAPVVLNSIVLGNQGGNLNAFLLGTIYQGANITDVRSPAGGGVGPAPADVFAEVTGPGGGNFTTAEGAGVLGPNPFGRQSVELRRRGAAIDVGDAALLPPTNTGPTATDGRGAPRLVDFDGDGAALDLGAAELQAVDRPIEVTGETEVRLPEGQPFNVFVGGPLAISDPDADDPQPAIIGAAEGAFGNFQIDGEGRLTYVRDPGRPDLGAGQSESDAAVFTPVDAATGQPIPGAAFTVTATILGVNAADGGNNLLLGDASDDVFDGLGGDDTLVGGGGADLLNGRGGEDVLRGGGGEDTLRGGGGDDVLRGGAGADRLIAGGGADLAVGGGGGDLLRGGAGDDTLRGGGGADRIFGNGGADELVGNVGADALFGGGGADRLVGGRGRDALAGGAGRDVFVIGRGDGRDTVLDFRAGFDRIEVTSGAERFADLVLAQRGADAVVRLGAGGDALVLEGVAVADLAARDFLFT